LLLFFSLVNIYKELAQDCEGFKIPNHGNLTGWAKQGSAQYQFNINAT